MYRETALEEEISRFLKKKSLRKEIRWEFDKQKIETYKDLLKKDKAICDYYIYKIEGHLKSIGNEKEKFMMVNKKLNLHLTTLYKLSNSLSAIK